MLLSVQLRLIFAHERKIDRGKWKEFFYFILEKLCLKGNWILCIFKTNGISLCHRAYIKKLKERIFSFPFFDYSIIDDLTTMKINCVYKFENTRRFYRRPNIPTLFIYNTTYLFLFLICKCHCKNIFCLVSSFDQICLFYRPHIKGRDVLRKSILLIKIIR